MIKKRSFISNVFVWAIMLIASFLAVFPLVWMILASFKKKTEVFKVPLRIFPTEWVVTNYTKVFKATSSQDF